MSALYAPESQSKIAALNQEWTQTGSLQNEEIEVLTKAGKRRTVLMNKEAVKDAQGNILHSASVLVDITDYKEVQQKLRDSQNRLESIVASAMDAIIATDSEQRIVVFNAAAEAMFGCPAPGAFLSSIERFIPKRFRCVHQEHVHRFGTTGVGNRAMGTVSSLWGLRANGEEFPMEMSISQVETDGKKFVVTIIRDVTERRQAEEAVRESEQRFRLVANMAPVMIWMRNTDKLCTSTAINPGSSSPAALLKRNWAMVGRKGFTRTTRSGVWILSQRHLAGASLFKWSIGIDTTTEVTVGSTTWACPDTTPTVPLVVTSARVST